MTDESHYILSALEEWNRNWGESVTLVEMLADKELRSKMMQRAQELKAAENARRLGK